VQLSKLKKNFVPIARLSKKLAPDVAPIFSQLRVRYKKLKSGLVDLKGTLEILES
jgi:hypothetical protein